MISEWWVSCSRMTVWVMNRDGYIMDTAPVTKRFIGQPFSNLLRWFERIGGLEYRRIDDAISNAR